MRLGSAPEVESALETGTGSDRRGSGSIARGRSRRGEDLGGVDDGGVPVGVHDLVDLVIEMTRGAKEGERDGKGTQSRLGFGGRVPARPLISAAHSAASSPD